MKLVNCKKCGILFNMRLRPICDSCLEVDKRNVQKINDFVNKYTTPFISMELIAQETGISFKDVNELYKTGQLTNIAGRITVRCKSCGAELRGVNKIGYFCKECILKNIDEKSSSEVRKELVNQSKAENTRKVRKTDKKEKYSFKKCYD